MKLLLTVLLTSSACVSEPTPALEATQHFARVPITTYTETGISDESEAAFSRYVQRQIAVWNDGLEARGCEPPFTWVPSLAYAHMNVVLAPDVTTRFPANGGGFFDGRDVYVQAGWDGTYDQMIRIDVPIQLQHELGHALGLGHTTRDDSVMSGHFKRVAESDLEDAARAIGCE